ncbi:MAG: hypothetical protein V9E87_02675 [Gemmatimonadales bacterium]
MLPPLLQQLRQVQAVPLAARHRADLLLLVRALEAEPAAVGAAESVTDFNSLSQEINNSNLVLPQTLTTTAETTPANDVIVHPPGPKRKGQLIVTGKIGVGQNETFMLKKCRMESDQIPMK